MVQRAVIDRIQNFDRNRILPEPDLKIFDRNRNRTGTGPRNRNRIYENFREMYCIHININQNLVYIINLIVVFFFCFIKFSYII